MNDMDSFQISIIIPSYNSAKTIRDTIYSCLIQEEIKFEIIVVDDLGEDNTRAILEDIKKSCQEGIINLIYRKSGLGQSTARNVGIKKAIGKYICFLDSDDKLCNSKVLKKWYESIEKKGSDFEIANFYSINDGKKRSIGRLINSQKINNLNIKDNPELVNAVSCWQILYSAKFLKEKNIYFSENLRQREDRLFIILAFLNSEKISYKEDLYVIDHYNLESSSFTQININQLKQYIQHLKELNAHFQDSKNKGYFCDDFINANAGIYLMQFCTYWNNLVLDEIFTNRLDIIKEYFDQLYLLVKDIPPLYKNKILNVETQQGFMYEGALDIARICLKTKDPIFISLALKIKNNSFPLKYLYQLKNVDNSSEECIARYLSFSRRKVDTTINEDKNLRSKIKKIIFHIGLTKTGSSSLQQFFERNRLKLWEKGYHYPISGAFREYGSRRERTPGHAQLVASTLVSPISVRNSLVTEIEEINEFSNNKIDKLILSAENIVSTRFWKNGLIMDSIKDTFHDVEDINFCIVFRHPTSWIISQYLENIGNHLNSFSDSLVRFTETLKSKNLTDWNSILRKLEKINWAKVKVGIYENILKNGGIENWFSDTFELNISNFDRHKLSLSNESASQIKALTINSIKNDKRLNRKDLENIAININENPFFNKFKKKYTKNFLDEISSFENIFNKEITNYEKKYGIKIEEHNLIDKEFDIYSLGMKEVDNYLFSEKLNVSRNHVIFNHILSLYEKQKLRQDLEILIIGRMQIIRLNSASLNCKYIVSIKNDNNDFLLEKIIYPDYVDCLISSSLLKGFYEKNKLKVDFSFFKYDQNDNLIDMFSEQLKIFCFQEENSYWLINSEEIYNLI